MELVSIVVPVYNMEKQLEKSICSILRQTYTKFELILVDDGSTDNSLALCYEMGKKDSRIKVLHEDNSGAGIARNMGIDNASGKYIYFPDADDELDDYLLEKLVDKNKECNCDLIVFGYNCIDTKGNLVKIKNYKNCIFEGDYIRNNYSNFYATEDGNRIQGAPWNKLFSLELIKKHKIRFPSLRRHQDEAFIARYVTYVNRVLFVNEVLYTYYLNDLKREWEKYPTNYYEAVIGLYRERQSNILKWNDLDKTTHDMVYMEYIYYIIKSLELSFGSKYSFNIKSRIRWMKDVVEKSEILHINTPKGMHKYQSVVKWCMKKKLWLVVYLVLRFKIAVQFYTVNKNT